jgi:ubiquitin-like protein Pup
MSESIRQTKSSSNKDQAESIATSQDVPQTTEIVDALEDILDQIDEVLEENAEEFVKNYVQKGGE